MSRPPGRTTLRLATLLAFITTCTAFAVILR